MMRVPVLRDNLRPFAGGLGTSQRRVVTAVVMACVLTTACGSRLGLSSAQRQSAQQSSIGAGSGFTDQGGVPTGTISSSGVPAPAGSVKGSGGLAGPAVSGVAPGLGEVTVAGKPGQKGASPTLAVASGDNGGATDAGVTGTSITVGNVSDLSGPVPGLFQGAVDGTEAYFAYLNSQGGINGRQVKLQAADGQTDCTANQNAHASEINDVFAFVGSFSLYDDCGTTVLQAHPGVPDVSFALGPKTQANTVNQFSPQFLPTGGATGPFCALAQKYPEEVKAVGSIYSNIPSAATSQKAVEKAAAKCGWKWIDSIPTGATDTTFNAQVNRMRSDGVKLVFETADTTPNMAEMKKEADAQGWKPTWVAPIAYSSSFFDLMGSSAAAEGVLGYNLYSLFLGDDEAARIPEVALFQTWMKRVHPEASMDLFAMYGWAAAKLFSQQIRAIGPHITRKAFLDSIRNVHSYDADRLLTPSDVGGHQPGHCYLLWQAHNGKFERLDSPDYRCDGHFVRAS